MDVPAGIAARFGSLDVLVLVIYLAGTTYLGYLFRAKDATIKDFFLGGRKLPWPAVCGSIIATEVSAVTFIGAPAIVFAATGNLTYLQLAIGTILARFIIGFWFVPAFYRNEIYSPYEYMGSRLGPGMERVTTGLFFLGAVLGQGVRVYATALVLEVVTGWGLERSIWMIGIFSIVWTYVGGISTVIWTDVVQFLLFLVGGIVALVWIFVHVPEGASGVFQEAFEAGKLRLLNLSTDPTVTYTLWAGLFGTTFLTLASHGTDQMMAQRMFCCRDESAARKAIIVSSLSQGVTILMMLVGVGLWAFYRHFPLEPGGAAWVAEKADRIFPIFIVKELPAGVTGLIIAGIFAAAISSLDSTLAALSQTTVNTFYRGFIRPDASERHYIKVSRGLILFWGIALSGMAILCSRVRQYPELIDQALAMTGYTYGALLGGLLLSLMPLRVDTRGMYFGVPLSILLVFGLSWHGPIARWFVLCSLVLLAGLAVWQLRREWLPLATVMVFAVVVYVASWHVLGYDVEGMARHIRVAWPWNYPLGCFVTLTCGILVGRRCSSHATATDRS